MGRGAMRRGAMGIRAMDRRAMGRRAIGNVLLAWEFLMGFQDMAFLPS